MLTRRTASRPAPWLALACLAAPACFSDEGPHATTLASGTTPSTSTWTSSTSTSLTTTDPVTTTGAPACGDGSLDPGETCDDGNLADDDACLATCQPNTCGDGFLDASAEECDDGANNHPHLPDACRPTCKLPVCGDGGLYTAALGPEIVVSDVSPANAALLHSKHAPRAIGIDGNNNFAVLWAVDAEDDQIRVRRLDSSGQLLAAALDYLNPKTPDAVNPVLAIRANGDFALAWGTPYNGGDLLLRGLVDGVPLDGIPATVSTNNTQESPSLAYFDSGRAVLAFIGQLDGRKQVRARLIDNFAENSPSEFTVSEHLVGDASSPTVTTLPSGAFAIAWGDPGGMIVYRRFTGDGLPSPVVTTGLRTGGRAETGSRPWTGAALRALDGALLIAGVDPERRVAVQRFDAGDIARELVPVADAPRLHAPYIDVATDAAGHVAVAWAECGQLDQDVLDCSSLPSDLRLRWLRSDMTPHAPPIAVLSLPVGPPPPIGLAVAPSGLTGVTYTRDDQVVVRVARPECP